MEVNALRTEKNWNRDYTGIDILRTVRPVFKGQMWNKNKSHFRGKGTCLLRTNSMENFVSVQDQILLCIVAYL